jgi:hypothetical protein
MPPIYINTVIHIYSFIYTYIYTYIYIYVYIKLYFEVLVPFVILSYSIPLKHYAGIDHDKNRLGPQQITKTHI